jgi:flagellar protein FlbD
VKEILKGYSLGVEEINGDTTMIHVTRLNHSPIVLNSDLIEHMQATPDTVITLTSGNNFMVLESPEEIVERIIKYRRRISSPFSLTAPGCAGPEGRDGEE